MAEAAFDNGIIISHPIYDRCGSTLNAVSKADYQEDFFDKRIACLDMDTYETMVCNGEKGRTMDAVIGIKEFSGNRFHGARLLLVELRMNYRSDHRLSKTELEQKLSHTKALLGNEIRINEKSYFVFRNNIIHRIRHWFRNKSREGGCLKHCEPVSTDEFNKRIMPEDKFPYNPQTDLTAMEKELSGFLSDGKYHCFIMKTEYWLKRAIAYKKKYNNEEYRRIAEVINKVWHNFRTSSPALSDDETLEAEILEEDYSILAKS